MNYLRQVLFTIFMLSVLLVACGGGTTSNSPEATPSPSPSPTTLNVFAAASLTESFNEIKTRYQAAHPTIKITYNFNGSQLLEQQIANGAPADVFASADQTNMQKASSAGLVENPQVLVKNRLVVIVPASGSGTVTNLKDLAREGVKIDIEAPTVPAGKYSLQVLDKMSKSSDYGPAYVSAVKSHFVSQEDNVKAVVQKVQLSEADAGFVYRTDVTTAIESKVKVIDIPDTFNVVAQYPIAVTRKTVHASDAQAFVQYVLSTEGQGILTKYHFIAGS